MSEVIHPAWQGLSDSDIGESGKVEGPEPDHLKCDHSV
jgi:hypothetical protein